MTAQPTPERGKPDMTDDPEYQAWIDECAKHCRCSACWAGQPCAGVLAGGICDDVHDREDEENCDDD